jgi:hypothetical protein
MTEAIIAAYCAHMQAIIGEWSPSTVVQQLALHASTDPEFLHLLLDVWVQQLDHAPDVAFEDELVSFIGELMTLPANFAVVMMRGTVSGGGAASSNSTGDWYLFGLEQTRFKVPFELLRTNFVMLACLFRLIYQGQPLPGRPVFAKTASAADRSESVCTEFMYPDMFSAHLDRVCLVGYFVKLLCVKTYVIAAARADKNDYLLIVRQLLLSALQRVETRLAAKRPEWLLGNDALARLHEITVLCQSRESFDPGRFLSLFRSFIARRLLVARK